MARSLIVVVFLVLGVVGVPSLAFAQGLSAANDSAQSVANTAGVGGGTDLFTIIGRIIYVALGFVGILLLVYLLYAGYLWMTSGGDVEDVKKAKLMIRNAIIGLLIIVSSFAITAYILSLLEGVTGTNGGLFGGGPGGGAGFGTSGNGLNRGGIIQDHIPSRDATDVPRNTSIIITFKRPIKIASVIQGYDDHGTPADLSDDTSSTDLHVGIFQIAPVGGVALAPKDVHVAFTADRKTFVIKPICSPANMAHCLGNATSKTNYVAAIKGGSGGLLDEGGAAALDSKGYQWGFQVSTVLDLTPPRVVSVIPSSGGQYAPNIVVQVNFSKPVDPTSAAGTVVNGGGFTNLVLSATKGGAQATYPDGDWRVSNGYRTVEFVSNLPCGVNSCGRKIFCLPINSVIGVVVKSATLSAEPPQAKFTKNGYDGVTDFVGNSLDGNGNGKAEGPSADNYDPPWTFGTTARPNLDPPIVKATQPPVARGGHVPVDQSPSADFNGVIQPSTVTNDSAYIAVAEPASANGTFWALPRETFLDKDGLEATGTNSVVAGRISINHRLYLPATTSTSPEYDPVFTSDLQNAYQNCFNPAGSPACPADATNRSCCQDTPQAAGCNYPPAPPKQGP